MKAVLFDLDNTLLFKRPSVAEKWYEVLHDHGCGCSLSDVHRAFAACEMWVGEQIQKENETGIRLNDDDFLKGVIKCCTDALCIDETAGEFLTPVWMGRYEREYALAPGAVSVLEKLLADGMLLGIVSNNHLQIRDTLLDLDILKYFSTVVISEEVDLYKPDPEILLYACRALGVESKDAIYVGDHPYDIVCAREAKMTSAWIPVNEFMKLPSGVSEPEIRLDALTDLIL